MYNKPIIIANLLYDIEQNFCIKYKLVLLKTYTHFIIRQNLFLHFYNINMLFSTVVPNYYETLDRLKLKLFRRRLYCVCLCFNFDYNETKKNIFL